MDARLCSIDKNGEVVNVYRIKPDLYIRESDKLGSGFFVANYISKIFLALNFGTIEVYIGTNWA